jgi:hypothetical protein
VHHRCFVSVSSRVHLSNCYVYLNDCIDYPWSNVKFDGWPQLRRWFFLADYTTPPLAVPLIGKLISFFNVLN